MEQWVLYFSLAYKKLTFKKLQDALVKTLEISALIMVLVAASNFFGAVFSRLRNTNVITDFLLGLEMNKYLILALIMVMIFLLGWPLEWVPIVMIIIPIILPLVEALGFNLTWFAILVAVNLQTAWLSPPVALICVFFKRCSTRMGFKRYLLWNDAIYGYPSNWININYCIS